MANVFGEGFVRGLRSSSFVDSFIGDGGGGSVARVLRLAKVRNVKRLIV
jgi:hypothetical protein